MALPDPAQPPHRRWRLGYASGAFDLFHVGHLRYLQAAADRCDHLIVGVPEDAIITRVKGRPPVNPLVDRLAIVAALACVGAALPVAVPMDETERFVAFAAALGIDVIFVGADWAATARWARLGPRFAARGIAVIVLPRTEGVSSTRLRDALAAESNGAGPPARGTP